jgi:hypothetical protein
LDNANRRDSYQQVHFACTRAADSNVLGTVWQSMEIERLFSEAALLAEGVADKTALAVMWEQQVHSCLAQNRQLTAMLQEQARWPTEEAQAGAEASPTHQLMEAKAEAARLQQRVDELSHQFTRANAKCGDLLQVPASLPLSSAATPPASHTAPASLDGFIRFH